MTTQEPSHPEAAKLGSKEVTLNYVGLVSGIPLPRETLALVAMHRIYIERHAIVEKVALNLGPCFIGRAQELVRALLIIEELLEQAGVSTERAANFSAHFPAPPEPTYLQELNQVLNTDSLKPDSKEDRGWMYAQVNKAFRPWVKLSKSERAAAKATAM